jgi:hypothetical protein
VEVIEGIGDKIVKAESVDDIPRISALELEALQNAIEESGVQFIGQSGLQWRPSLEISKQHPPVAASHS